MTQNTPTDRKSQEKIVQDFLASNFIAVFCTVNDAGLPEAATMAYSRRGKLDIVFQTPSTTRKYANLHRNPHIAVVIGWIPEDQITVQYEGIAREVTDDAEREILTGPHSNLHEVSKRYVHVPENKFFVVSPTAIRYSNANEGIQFTLDFAND